MRDPETLKRLFRYDPDTGALTWRERPLDAFKSKQAHSAWNTRYRGAVAGSISPKLGYVAIGVHGKKLYGHHVAWTIQFGVWPTGQLDHINGKRADNRIENLREVTNQENNRNRKIPSNNKSGRIGVCWHKSNAKWCAQIGVDGRTVRLGYFDNLEDACAARSRAEDNLGFSEHHGRSA